MIIISQQNAAIAAQYYGTG